MNEILRQMSNIYVHGMNPYMVAKFVGVLLVLKKHGALEGIDCNNPHLALMDLHNIDMSDAMHTISQETIDEVKKTTQIEIFIHIINFLAMSEFSEGEYLRWYDYCLELLSTKNNPFAMFSAPQTFATLVDAFLPSENLSVFNPFGGMMHLATDMARYQTMDACEINREVWALGMLRIELSGNADKVTYTNRRVDAWTDKQYDAIVAMPPFNAKLQMCFPSSFVRNGSPEEMEGIAVSRFAESTTSDGCCITFVSPSVLWASGEKARIREWATTNRYIDTIILLPKNLLESTSIPVVCLVLRKNSYHKDGVRMIDASGIYTNYQGRNRLEIGQMMAAFHTDTESVSRTVSYDEISNLDFSWNVREYLQKEEECPEGYTRKVFEELVEMPRLTNSANRDKGLTVKISDLSDDWTHPFIDLANLPEENNLRNYTRLDRPAILLSTVRVLKPSIVAASEKCPVWLHPHVLAIVPNECIDPEYLCMTLAKMEVPTIGYGAPHISRTYLLRQKIAFPELAMQKSLYREASRENALSKVQELGLQEVIEQMKADYINEVRARKHDMKTPMTQLRNSLTLIKELVAELPDEFASRLDKYVSRQQKAMDVLSDIVSHIADEDVFATPEVVDIEAVLRSFETVTDKYVIEYHRDDTSLKEAGIEIPYLKIGKVDFVRLAQNIVSNAVKRGFVKDNAEYALNITLSVENDFFVIDFSNNGEPLPDGMDKQRYGTKGAKGIDSDGSGTGGYIVKSITQHYGGDFDIFSSKFANMDFTNVIVKLPIYRKEDE